MRFMEQISFACLPGNLESLTRFNVSAVACYSATLAWTSSTAVLQKHLIQQKCTRTLLFMDRVVYLQLFS